MKRVAILLLALTACGGHKAAQGPKAAEQGLPPANPVAVQRMVEGVTAAKDPRMQTRAIALLREAFSIDPNLWEARFDLGIVLANGGDLAHAEDELKAAAKLAPEREEVQVALAEVRRRRGSNREAAGGLEDFVKDHPGALDARTLLVTSLRDSGQHDKAIAQAREVLVRKPGNETALAELALCHLGKGERDTAQLLVKQALDVNAKSAIAHRVQGLVYLGGGDDALAFQEFSKAAQEDPKDTTSRLNMGAVLLRAGSYAKAAEQYRGALAASPDEAAALVGLAAALRGESGGKDMKLVEEARSLLDKVIERDPHNIAALFNMGILQAESLKKPGDAKPFFERFLEDAPKDHPARPEAEKQLAGGAAAKPAAPAPRPTTCFEEGGREVMRRVLFGVVAIGTAVAILEVGAEAQTRKPAAAKPGSGKGTGAGAGTGKSDGGGGAISESAPSSATRDGGKGGAVLENKTVDGGAKVFRFGEVEVEGRLKSPQIVYFLRRVRAEFAAGDLGHRSFMSELDETKNESGF